MTVTRNWRHERFSRHSSSLRFLRVSAPLRETKLHFTQRRGDAEAAERCIATSALPTRRDEALRYSDLDALARVWPLPAAECVVVPAGGNFVRTIVQDGGSIHQLDLAIGKGATAAIHVLNIGGDYGRVELNVTLHEGADFKLGAVQIGGGSQTLEIITTVTHAEPGATSSQIGAFGFGGHSDRNLSRQSRRCARCTAHRSANNR